MEYLYINICIIYVYFNDKKSVALIIQTYLKLDRSDLAKRELASTKTWAEDAMLAQLIEAWVGLRTVNI